MYFIVLPIVSCSTGGRKTYSAWAFGDQRTSVLSQHHYGNAFLVFLCCLAQEIIYILKFHWDTKLPVCLLLPFVIIWFRGRWRSSWCDRSTVKCWATRLPSAIFMPLNWLSKALFWKRESVGLINNSFLRVSCVRAYLFLWSTRKARRSSWWWGRLHKPVRTTRRISHGTIKALSFVANSIICLVS